MEVCHQSVSSQDGWLYKNRHVCVANRLGNQQYVTSNNSRVFRKSVSSKCVIKVCHDDKTVSSKCVIKVCHDDDTLQKRVPPGLANRCAIEEKKQYGPPDLFRLQSLRIWRQINTFADPPS